MERYIIRPFSAEMAGNSEQDPQKMASSECELSEAVKRKQKIIGKVFLTWDEVARELGYTRVADLSVAETHQLIDNDVE